MTSSYFDQKIKTYLLNIISKKPNIISEATAVRIWHEIFSDEEILIISKEISKIEIKTYLNNDENISASASKKIKMIENFSQLGDNLLDLETAEEIFGELRGLSKEFIKRVCAIIIRHANNRIIHTEKDSDERLLEIKKLFKLSDIELELMTLYYCSEYSSDFCQIVQRASDNEDISRPSNSKNFISNIIHFSPHQIIQSLGKSSRLISLGILEFGRSVSMSNEFIDFLSGYSNDALIEKYARIVSTNDSLKMENHLIPAQKLETLEAILKSKPPCSILFYGKPGTGKTELVKYLGQELGKEILLKRASDLLSMWVGGSEKNIRLAFEEAEREKKILFIDEADSLLSQREGHNRTWETTQVNEILTCMENFRGILLCATNHVENLDTAAQRRFLFKLKFDYLDKSGVIHFYEKFFTRYVCEEMKDSELEILGSVQGLTPSDFNNLKRKFDIIAPLNHGEILEQLKLEIGYKKNLFKKKIGV